MNLGEIHWNSRFSDVFDEFAWKFRIHLKSENQGFHHFHENTIDLTFSNTAKWTSGDSMNSTEFYKFQEIPWKCFPVKSGNPATIFSICAFFISRTGAFPLYQVALAHLGRNGRQETRKITKFTMIPWKHSFREIPAFPPNSAPFRRKCRNIACALGILGF